ncbi:hypothetical protein J6590_104992 [Homalodisca vitripennis]|nr:hypothetical protein J6590_104992 [Homalodisca vitripennis]
MNIYLQSRSHLWWSPEKIFGRASSFYVTRLFICVAELARAQSEGPGPGKVFRKNQPKYEPFTRPKFGFHGSRLSVNDTAPWRIMLNKAIHRWVGIEWQSGRLRHSTAAPGQQPGPGHLHKQHRPSLSQLYLSLPCKHFLPLCYTAAI